MGKREKDNAILSLIEFIEYLREHPQEHKIEDLANHFKTHRSQIHRWMKYTQERYGIPLDIKRGSVKLGEGKHEVKRVLLDRFDVEALLAAAARVNAFTPFATEALYKLEDAQVFQHHSLEDPILYTPLVDEYPEELFERIVKAIRDYSVASVTYENSKGQKKTYNFNSYAIIVSEQHLHLIGESHNSIRAGYSNPISLRLDQIDEFSLIREKFKKPNFNIASYAQKTFGPFQSNKDPVNIQVQFSQEKAHYIKRTKRHNSQNVIPNPDGTDTVIWQITAPITDALVHWITSYGPHAKVLEPEALRQKVVNWAKGSLDANT